MRTCRSWHHLGGGDDEELAPSTPLLATTARDGSIPNGATESGVSLRGDDPGSKGSPSRNWLRIPHLQTFAAGLMYVLFALLCGCIYVGVSALDAQSYNQWLRKPNLAVVDAAAAGGWPMALAEIRRSASSCRDISTAANAACAKWLVVDVQFGLGNRLRALASAMAVAAAANRHLLLVWRSDIHCNCLFGRLFAQPPISPPFAVVDQGLERPGGLPEAEWQVLDYMNHTSDRWLNLDTRRHTYVRTAFQLAHTRGKWAYAKWQLRRLAPAPDVAALVRTNDSYIGVHVRSVFDDSVLAALQDRMTKRSESGREALAAASAEYGGAKAAEIKAWRNAGHWSRFINRLSREPAATRFFLAADSQDAYDGLLAAFPNRIASTPRVCASASRCDSRDCASLRLALADMLNLARTRRILGSYFSSFSEVAQHWDGDWPWGTPTPIEYAGVDFAPVRRVFA